MSDPPSSERWTEQQQMEVEAAFDRAESLLTQERQRVEELTREREAETRRADDNGRDLQAAEKRIEELEGALWEIVKLECEMNEKYGECSNGSEDIAKAALSEDAGQGEESWTLYPVQSEQIRKAGSDDVDHGEVVIRVDGPMPPFPIQVVRRSAPPPDADQEDYVCPECRKPAKKGYEGTCPHCGHYMAPSVPAGVEGTSK